MKKYLPILFAVFAMLCACHNDEPEQKHPVAAFNYKVVEKPFTVRFFNISEGLVGYRWDFGDGTTADEIAPTHEFQALGEYTVRLTGYTPENEKVTCARKVVLERPRVYIYRYGIYSVMYDNMYYYITIDNDKDSDYWGYYIEKRTDMITEDNIPYVQNMERRLELNHLDADDYYYVSAFWSNSKTGDGTQCMRQKLTKADIDRCQQMYLFRSDNQLTFICLYMTYE